LPSGLETVLSLRQFPQTAHKKISDGAGPARDISWIPKLLWTEAVGEQRVGGLQQRTRRVGGTGNVEFPGAPSVREDAGEDGALLLEVPGAALDQSRADGRCHVIQ
jgi:hypothetical protein